MKKAKDLKIGDIVFHINSVYGVHILKIEDIIVSLKNERYRITLKDVNNEATWYPILTSKDDTQADTNFGTIYFEAKEVIDILETVKKEIKETLKDIKGLLRIHLPPKDGSIPAYSHRTAVLIQWDTGENLENEEKPDLPTEVNIPEDISEDEIADYLSDKYGFLVSSFQIQK